MPARHLASAESMEATLTHLKLPMGLILDRVSVQGQGISLHEGPLQLSLRKPGKLDVIVSAESIAAFLNHKSPPSVRDFAVAIEEGKLLVQATAKVIVSVRVAAECTLEIVDKKQLFVRLKSVTLGPSVQKLVQNQLDSINPVLDVRDLPIKASLEKVALAHGEVHASGAVRGL